MPVPLPDSRGVLDEMPTPLVIVERDSAAVIYANRAASAFAAAFSPDAILYDEAGERVTGETLPHVVAAAGHAFERRVVRADDHAWLMFHARVLDDVAIVTFDDVTALHEAHADLREAVVARDELISLASHELRSPIGTLSLAVEQVARLAKSKSLDALARIADIGMRQVKQLTLLVSNLLDVSRLRAGRFELGRETCDLAQLVRDATSSLVSEATQAGAALIVKAETPVVGIWDPMRMEQVVTNLVVNAIKYGNGTPICVTLTHDGNCARFEVDDCGPGIPHAHHDRIFEPFHRASEHAKAHSLGLGLYIVSEIVKAHGGTIRVESRPGFTRFAIALPIE